MRKKNALIYSYGKMLEMESLWDQRERKVCCTAIAVGTWREGERKRCTARCNLLILSVNLLEG
jgi:hypothetical protein